MDQNIVITYETLYELLRREKYRPELQKLDENFFNNVVKYIEEKTEILASQRKKVSIFASTEIVNTQKQLDNINKILKELYEKRESKILQIALFSSRTNVSVNDTESMLPEEKEFYEAIKGVLNDYRTGILYKLLEKKLPKIEPKDIKRDKKNSDKVKLVRFVSAIPQFVGSDMQEYGPFETEDIANLPLKVANVLIRKNRAKEIKI